MTEVLTAQDRRVTRYVDVIDGGAQVPVMLAGPPAGRAIIMFDEPSQTASWYEALRERLHVAMFRTVVIPAHDGLTPKSVVAVLDQLQVPGGLLVGDGVGGDLAWSVAAYQGSRFTGLVVIDSGHPGVADPAGKVCDITCPAVEVDTTALVSTPTTQALARASRRMVNGEFRLVEAAGRRSSRHFMTQLATEIVVRALSR